MESFSSSVRKQLGHYVYRLIDPRNGQTFYVGRGQGDRVFAHVRNALRLRNGEDAQSEKLKTIKMIEDAGLEPVHVVHRHGMNLNTAAEVEATLIDCFPGSTNEVAGKGSNERGPANVKQLQNRYERPVMELNSDHKLLFIKTRQQTMEEKGLYEAVRGCWTLTPERAGRADYILAVVDGVCKGVFKADDDGWKPCKRPGQEKRWEFDGREVKGEVADLYVEKLIPADKRKPGMASPYLYENC